jgi:GR25 family glycosyltransferase involved in LPS biosynthesis
MKAFIIYLPQKPHSVEHSTNMYNQLKQWNIDVTLFEGIDGGTAMEKIKKDARVLYPYSIKSNIISEKELRDYLKPEIADSFIENHWFNIRKKVPVGKGEGKMSMPGVIGCFYSHLLLWLKCVELNEPIMIFEDDVKFYRDWTPIDWKDVLILSLGKTAFLNPPYDLYLNAPSKHPQPQPWPNVSMPGTSGYAIKPEAASALIKFYRGYFYPSDNAINQNIVTIEIHNYLMGRHLLEDEGNISMTRTKLWDNT